MGLRSVCLSASHVSVFHDEFDVNLTRQVIQWYNRHVLGLICCGLNWKYYKDFWNAFFLFFLSVIISEQQLCCLYSSGRTELDWHPTNVHHANTHKCWWEPFWPFGFNRLNELKSLRCSMCVIQAGTEADKGRGQGPVPTVTLSPPEWFSVVGVGNWWM